MYDAQNTLALLCEVAWDSDAARHRDAGYLESAELGLDRLPRELTEALEEKDSGFRTTVRFEPGSLLPEWHRDQVLTLPSSRFAGRLPGVGVLVPRAGRFYPRRLLTGDGGAPLSGGFPFRVIGVDDGQLTVDLNHPLAGKPLTLSAEILPSPTNARHDRGGLDLISALLDDGPGMQGRHNGRATDFFEENSFTRSDPSDDANFYRQPRLVDHLDSTAINEISILYGRLIPPRSRILDLMSSWHSHLPTTLEAESITGLGMNADELAHNRILTERVVHDLNAVPHLPFAAERFDAVVCSLSVEYLTDPLAVFRDLARVLAPDGVAIITFSNRWFPPKVIRGWTLLHEFERPGSSWNTSTAAIDSKTVTPGAYAAAPGRQTIPTRTDCRTPTRSTRCGHTEPARGLGSTKDLRRVNARYQMTAPVKDSVLRCCQPIGTQCQIPPDCRTSRPAPRCGGPSATQRSWA